MKKITIFVLSIIFALMAAATYVAAVDDAENLSYGVYLSVETQDGIPMQRFNTGDTFVVKIKLQTLGSGTAPLYAMQYKFLYNSAKLSVVNSQTEFWGRQQTSFDTDCINAVLLDIGGDGIPLSENVTLAEITMTVIASGTSMVSVDDFILANHDTTLRNVDTDEAGMTIVSDNTGDQTVLNAKITLNSDIITARRFANRVAVSYSAGSDVYTSLLWTTREAHDAVMLAIIQADEVFANETATLTQINNAIRDLGSAYELFLTQTAAGTLMRYTVVDYNAEYNVSAYTGGNGTINAESISQTAKMGTSVSVDFTPADGYEAYQASVNGMMFAATGTRFTVASVDGDTSITIMFRKKLPFGDVPVSAWYCDAVRFAFENKLITGVSDTEFAPDGKMTRGMLVTLLGRLENIDIAMYSGSPSFTDVSNSAWYAPYTAWAYAEGIVQGSGDNAFSPESALTRQELVTMLHRYADYKKYDTSARTSIEIYTDAANVASWAKDSISWSVAESLVGGVTATELAPADNVTRAQVATFMMRFIKQFVY